MAEIELYNQFSQPKDIPSKLINEIETGMLSIPSQPRQLKIHQSLSTSSVYPNIQHRQMIEKVRKSKDQTIKQLRELEQQEQELKAAMRKMSSPGNQSKKKKMDRSDFTVEEKEKIKTIIKMAKKEEQSKKKQHQLLLENFNEQIKKKREEEQQLVEKLREQHKKAVEQNLKKLQIRKKNRQQSTREVNRRMQELRQKKYIYSIKTKEDQEIRQRQEKEKQEKLEQIKNRCRLDFQEITDHQKNYEEIKERKSEERKEKLKTDYFRAQSTSRKYSSNMFMRLLMEEEKEKKLEQLRKQNQAKQLRNKVQEYKKTIIEKYLPRTQTESHSKSPSPKKTHALSHKQMLQKGNAYLRELQKQNKQKQLSKSKDNSRTLTQPHTKQSRYIDYLKAMGRKSRNSPTMQQFRSIVSKDESIQYLEAVKAKNLVEQIEAKSKKTRDQRLYESIQNKIQLLKVLL